MGQEWKQAALLPAGVYMMCRPVCMGTTWARVRGKGGT